MLSSPIIGNYIMFSSPSCAAKAPKITCVRAVVD
jgi:hypothetical protein